MENIKYLDTSLTTFNENQTRSKCEDGSILISITTILNALKKYEVGIPKEYFERDGVYFGIESWLRDEEEKGNIVSIEENNTYDMAGKCICRFWIRAI